MYFSILLLVLKKNLMLNGPRYYKALINYLFILSVGVMFSFKRTHDTSMIARSRGLGPWDHLPVMISKCVTHGRMIPRCANW